VVYSGLVHTALGNASLTPQGTELIVANLGSSGQDGVSVTLPPTGRWDAQWLPLDAGAALPAGSFLEATAIGSLDGTTELPIAVLTAKKLNTEGYALSANFAALGAFTCTIDIYDGSQLVKHVTGSGNDLGTCSFMPKDIEISTYPPYFQFTWHSGGGSARGTLFTLKDGTSVYGDRMALTPENSKNVVWLSTLQLRSSGINELHITLEQRSVVYSGLVHTALGNASLTPQGTELIVANLGSSGQDGVSIIKDRSRALEAHWLPIDSADSLAVGAYIEETVIGSVAGQPGRVFGKTRMTKTGSNKYVIDADFSAIGAGTRRVEVYYGDVLRAQVKGQNGPVGTASKLRLDLKAGLDGDGGYIKITFKLNPSEAVDIALNGGPTVQGDMIVLRPEGGEQLDWVSEIQLRFIGIPLLTLTEEHQFVYYAGLTHESLGNASLTVTNTATQSSLILDNLGSSGQDGVSIAVKRATRWDAAWLEPDPAGTTPNGAMIKSSVIGSIGGVEKQNIATVSAIKTESNKHRILADFSSIGSLSRTVQVYQGDTLQAEVHGQSGDIGLASSWPRDLHIRFWPLPVLIEITFNGGGNGSATDIVLNGGATVTGDRLVLIPDNAPAIDFLSEVQLQISGIPSLFITNESVVTSPLILMPSLTGGKLILQWPSGGVLLESSDLNLWDPVPNAVSPSQVSPDGQQRFFRIHESDPPPLN
jgi:hypothetical protein